MRELWLFLRKLQLDKKNNTTMGKSKISAIATCHCPQCREGKVFKHSALKLGKVLEIHEHCPVCNFRYEIEPGFFWAAMYISYGINVAFIIGIFLVINLTTGSRNALHYLVPIISTIILTFPFTLRYSRILLLHFFSGAKYNRQANTSH